MGADDPGGAGEPSSPEGGVGSPGGRPRDTGPDLSQQDWLLMQRIAGGDNVAITQLYDRFSSLVFKTARQILPSRSEADDAMQEIFIRLWQTADRFDPQRAKLVTWVMLIARRHLIDRLRRNLANPNPATLDETWSDRGADLSGPRPERNQIDAERNERLRARIELLPKLQRLVIERAYLQGFTLREVSEQLDAPLGTIKSALSRGLAKLRDDLRHDTVIRERPDAGPSPESERSQARPRSPADASEPPGPPRSPA